MAVRRVPRASGAASMSRKSQLVGPLGRVPGGQFGRVALVAQVHESCAFDHPASGYVEARDDPSQQHQAAMPTKSASRRRPSAPERSGWNCVPSRRPLATMLANRPPWVVSASTTSSFVGRPANEWTK